MLRVILVISLAIAVGAKDNEQTMSDEWESEFPSLEWLFERAMKKVEEPTSTEMKSKRRVCNTKECQAFAKRLQDSMNSSANPCDDFYEYACGNWANNHKPPSEKITSWNILDEVGLKVTNQLKDMLTASIKPDDVLSVKILKKWYIACMDTDALEEKGMEPVVSTLARVGGWPLAMEKEIWDEDVFKWQVVDDYYTRLSGMNSLHMVEFLPISRTADRIEVIPYIKKALLPPRTGSLYDEVHSDDEDNSEECEDTNDDDNGDSENQSGDDDDDNHSESDDNDDGNNDDDNDSDNSISEDSGERKIRLGRNKKLHKNNKIRHARKLEAVPKSKRTNQKKKEGVLSKKDGYVKGKKSSHRVKKIVHKALNNRVKRSLLPKVIHHQVKYHIRDTHKHKLSEHRRSKKARLDKTDSDESTTESTTDEDDDKDDKESEDTFLPLLKEYYNYISDVAIAVIKESEADVDLDDLHEDIANVILFQLDIYDLPGRESHENMSLTEFQQWYDNLTNHNSDTKVNWKNKIIDLFTEANVKFDAQMIAVNTDYFKALKKLIHDTPTRTIVNYIHWRYLSFFIQGTTKRMRDLFDKWQSGREDMLERHDKCLPDGRMEELAAYEFVKRRFTDEKKEIAADMIDDIQKELEYLMKDSDWLDDETRDFVLTKLIHMKETIGYPEWYNNDTLVKQHLRGITVGSSYYENLLSYVKYTYAERLRLIETGITREMEMPNSEMSPTMVNAEFNPTGNSLVITAADFESPLFALDRPNIYNFAVLGSIMAHEVNHGFDDYDHIRDKHGEEKEWLSAMAKAYRSRAQCFIEQYDEYIEQMGLSEDVQNYGNLTLDENIADTMGVQTVYRALKRRQRECNRADDSLPGFEDFSDDQMFFLSYGLVWCDARKMDVLKVNVQSEDPHSIGPLRVIGPVSNSNDFAKAFHCPVGSPMNPEKKCNIWK